MSNCWCKCEAGIGQCGPKVPRLKSLFNAHKHSDELSLRRGDRQAELQVIWEVLQQTSPLFLYIIVELKSHSTFVFDRLSLCRMDWYVYTRAILFNIDQCIIQEIGEDKVLRLEELRQVVAVAVDKAYDKVLVRPVLSNYSLPSW